MTEEALILHFLDNWAQGDPALAANLRAARAHAENQELTQRLNAALARIEELEADNVVSIDTAREE